MNIKNISQLGAIVLITALAIGGIKNGKVFGISQEEKEALVQVKDEALKYMGEENIDEVLVEVNEEFISEELLEPDCPDDILLAENISKASFKSIEQCYSYFENNYEKVSSISVGAENDVIVVQKEHKSKFFYPYSDGKQVKCLPLTMGFAGLDETEKDEDGSFFLDEVAYPTNYNPGIKMIVKKVSEDAQSSSYNIYSLSFDYHQFKVSKKNIITVSKDSNDYAYYKNLATIW